jgi:hypothetical protein
MRREEIEAPFTALLERRREAYFGPARAQVDQGKAQQAVGRFKYDRPRADLARIAPHLRRRPPWRASADLARRHGGHAYRRHRASGKSLGPPGLSSRAIFALSTGLLTIGFAMLDQSPGIPSRKRTSRRGRNGTSSYFRHSASHSRDRLVAVTTARGEAYAAKRQGPVTARSTASSLCSAPHARPDAEETLPGAGRAHAGLPAAWATACHAAGVPGLLKHHLRGSAVRRMVNGGMSEQVGHEPDRPRDPCRVRSLPHRQPGGSAGRGGGAA